jgi:hypothetical protein
VLGVVRQAYGEVLGPEIHARFVRRGAAPHLDRDVSGAARWSEQAAGIDIVLHRDDRDAATTMADGVSNGVYPTGQVAAGG